LREHKVQHASTGPQRLPDWNPNAGGISAFYFRDTEGNYLEVLSFPPGKGAAKWHRPTDSLFLGIDHTAIVVADTDSSLAFYRDRLGMRVAGASENWGEEQERLNNVFGARLRITGREGDSGFGVELLESLSPRTGRPYPADSAANDAWHWQIRLATGDADALGEELRTAYVRWVSSGVVHLPDAAFGYNDAFMVRDPDGHANLIQQTVH
jgi:catechol 2,3-dioxygenase-like lactoylglutathione lyase family enzyme